MRKKTLILIKRFIFILVGVMICVMIGLFYWVQRSGELQPWHTYVPNELREKDIDRADWDDYINAENTLFMEVHKHVVMKQADHDTTSLNRYNSLSPVYPDNLPTDWNRSYIMRTKTEPRGAVVLLHGLTDSPYSLQHIARLYQQAGFVAIGIRLPAHGTVPGALTDVKWQDWLAATRLAVREATKMTNADTPLHIVGFSNGGALAMKYALDALDDSSLRKPQQIVLISPMIGVSRFARFSGMAEWTAFLPAFSRAAWLGLVPEFNPFKYNSFPVNGARQAYLLTESLKRELNRRNSSSRWKEFPHVLTFQSVLDSTVSTRAVLDVLHQNLPDNGSELVLFDINRAVNFRALFRHSSDRALSHLLATPERTFTTTIVKNASSESMKMVASTHLAHTTTADVQPLNLLYPRDVFSLSHVALPFPVHDSLYGSEPYEPNRYGLSLGILRVRGERAVLLADMDSLMRITSNPFFPYLMERIAGVIK
jgi:alpha-beta hydrolase superfamily lysophospholipase